MPEQRQHASIARLRLPEQVQLEAGTIKESHGMLVAIEVSPALLGSLSIRLTAIRPILWFELQLANLTSMASEVPRVNEEVALSDTEQRR